MVSPRWATFARVVSLAWVSGLSRKAMISSAVKRGSARRVVML
jgi:hypothetical protein